MSKLAPKSWPALTNNSPVAIPAIALGTFEAKAENKSEQENAVLASLQSGYRHIDTAAIYGSEPAVGAAIKKSKIPREEIVICTKIWNTHHSAEDVQLSVNGSLERLQVDYIDLLLIHWPVAFQRTKEGDTLRGEDNKPVLNLPLTEDHQPTWRAMESLVKAGKVRSLGVSNFTIPQLEKLLSYAEIKPACNQVEVHPWFPQTEMLEFCRKNGMVMTDYSPLGGQGEKRERVLDDATIVEAGKKLGLEPAQVVIAWALQRGTVPIPKSATASRIKSNFEVPELPQDVFDEIENITVKNPGRKHRFCNFDEAWGYPLFAEDK
ncbi:NADP-dependent oxidoreductase domain-containing protein [Elsinoe ampelina]|uniref:NADP-dependent oxidoreductase domain-containing protein n=1 Tax=Elsinoe ampelina TaxID=302913 RepID=A0A6A6GC47_9PEZI|nr:NADP-dependent oxidoreductase domain-containing protein [Elsinoe ampelina]